MLSFPKRIMQFTLLSLALGLTACASYTDELKEMNAAYRLGNYSAALQAFEKSGIKEQARNRMLYLLEKGTLEDRLGERESARKLWLKADAVADELFTKSMSKEALSYIYNDGAQAYSGEDFEKVAIHTMLAHSFLGDKILDSARVEAAKINTRLSEINGFYEDNKNKYRDDAYARYLSGMVFESLGEWDSAIVDYKAALKVYQSDYIKNFGTSAPNDLVKSLYRLLVLRDRKDEARVLLQDNKNLNLAKDDGKASIIVLHEVGVINEKRQEDFVVPWGSSVLRFSFPVIRRESFARRSTGIRLNQGSFQAGELAQDFNAIAYVNLEDRRLRMIAKGMARIILKNQVTQKAEKELGAIGWLAGNIYGAVTETADTRQWTTLPAAIYVTRLNVEAGSYDVEISNNGKIKDIQKISVKKGEVKILRDAGS